MDQFVYPRNLRELVAYQWAFNLSHGVFDSSKGFPEKENYALTSQIRQAHESPRVVLRSTMKTPKIPYSPIHSPGITPGAPRTPISRGTEDYCGSRNSNPQFEIRNLATPSAKLCLFLSLPTSAAI
ncbi:MAG: four helix bundle protein [Chthoniobacterales bacterium]